MRRFNVMDVVKIVKVGDKYENEVGTIVSIDEMLHVSVTIYTVEFSNGDKKYYFFSELNKVN